MGQGLRPRVERETVIDLLSCLAAFVAPQGSLGKKAARLLSDHPRSYISVRPRAVPANAYLSRALRVTHGSTAAIAASMGALGPQLSWSNTLRDQKGSRETGSALSPQVSRNFAKAMVAGPQGPAILSGIAMEILLFGPNTKFPNWVAKDPELLVLSSGAAGIKLGDTAWQPSPPGALFQVSAGGTYQVHTGSEPLLAARIQLIAP